MPLQMILLALMAMMTSEVIADNGIPRAVPPLQSTAAILAAVIGSYLVLVLIVAMVSRRTVRRLHASTAAASEITYGAHRLIDQARWTAIALLGFFLWYAGWGHMVYFGWGLGRYEMAAEFVFILPVVIAFLCLWTCTYYIDSAIRQRALPFSLQAGKPAHEMPGLASYLLMQSRHNFFILVIIAFKGLIDRLATDTPWTTAHPVIANVGIAGVAITLFVITPWIIVNMWRTVPLPDPPAARLYAVAKKYRIRFTRILLWHTHNMMPNAAILGPVPLVRYFLMTDALLESLTDRQIEAVFAHEIGHGYHRHMWWYVAFIFGATLFASAGAALAGVAIPYLQSDVANAIATFVLLAICMAWGFSFVSHRFENQADWFAAKHMAESLAQEPELLADRATIASYASEAGLGMGVQPLSNKESITAAILASPDAKPEPDYVKGAEIFGSSLRELVELTHRSLNKGGWLHPSVNQRVALVNRLATSPIAANEFDGMQRRLRWAIVAFVALGVALTGLAYLLNVPAW